MTSRESRAAAASSCSRKAVLAGTCLTLFLAVSAPLPVTAASERLRFRLLVASAPTSHPCFPLRADAPGGFSALPNVWGLSEGDAALPTSAVSRITRRMCCTTLSVVIAADHGSGRAAASRSLLMASALSATVPRLRLNAVATSTTSTPGCRQEHTYNRALSSQDAVRQKEMSSRVSDSHRMQISGQLQRRSGHHQGRAAHVPSLRPRAQAQRIAKHGDLRSREVQRTSDSAVRMPGSQASSFANARI